MTATPMFLCDYTAAATTAATTTNTTKSNNNTMQIRVALSSAVWNNKTRSSIMQRTARNLFCRRQTQGIVHKQLIQVLMSPRCKSTKIEEVTMSQK